MKKAKTTKVTKKSMFTEPLPFDEAAEYIDNFPAAIKPFFHEHLGGTVSADAFRRMVDISNFSGVMSWFCWDNLNPLSPKLFLAFEGLSDFEMTEDPAVVAALRPKTGDLIVPGNRFGHSMPSDVSDIKTVLMDHQIFPLADDETLTDVEAWDRTVNYLDLPLILSYQKYGMSYFENKTGTKNYITNLVAASNVHYIRYYFGFSHDGFPNRIRVLLVAVDDQGRNISEDSTGHETTLLQKSWPPPPNQ